MFKGSVYAETHNKPVLFFPVAGSSLFNFFFLPPRFYCQFEIQNWQPGFSSASFDHRQILPGDSWQVVAVTGKGKGSKEFVSPPDNFLGKL